MGVFLLILVIVVGVIYLNTTTTNNKVLKENNSVKNDDSNLIIENKNLKIILYKQDTCPHCVAFLPTWESLVDELDSLEIEHEIVECSEGGCENVQYIPTIRIFTDSTNYVDYEGDRTKKDIIDFISEL